MLASKQNAKGHKGDNGEPVPNDVHEDCDNIDFANYKGIYAEDENNEKYTCPVTGAHFEFNDISRRLLKVIEKRKPYEAQLYGTSDAKQSLK